MEGYRSSYPEGRTPYPEVRDPEFTEGNNWYGERPPYQDGTYQDYPDPERYEPERYEPGGYDDRSRREPERYEDPRREPPRPSPGETARAAAPPPRAASPLPEEPPMPRRPPPAAPGSPGPPSEGVYRSKRPGIALLIAAPTALLEVPALLLLRDAAFSGDASASGVVVASCLMLALPLLAVGLYAVATGAVRAAGPNSVQAWLRPPVAYLSVALVLLLAAGLAG